MLFETLTTAEINIFNSMIQAINNLTVINLADNILNINILYKK